MSRKFSIAFCGMFVGFISVLFLMNLVSRDREFSEMENRTLAQKPKFSVQALLFDKWTENYEKYITDQFTFRDSWVGLKYFSERALLKSENNGIYFADGGRLISRFDTPDEARVEQNFAAIDALAQKAGIPTKIMLAPTSAHVYKDDLPKFAPSYDQNIMFERASKLQNAEYIGVEQALIAAKDEYIYYRTDHHWTTRGAYIAYQEYMENAEREGEMVSQAELEATAVNIADFMGTLQSQAGARNYEADTITYYDFKNVSMSEPEGEEKSIYDLSYTQKKDKYALFFGGNAPILTMKNSDADAKGTLLVIKDSFANSILPYLSQNFKEIHVFDPRYNRTNAAEYAKECGADEILVMYQTANFATDVNIGLLGK